MAESRRRLAPAEGHQEDQEGAAEHRKLLDHQLVLRPEQPPPAPGSVLGSSSAADGGGRAGRRGRAGGGRELLLLSHQVPDAAVPPSLEHPVNQASVVLGHVGHQHPADDLHLEVGDEHHLLTRCG